MHNGPAVEQVRCGGLPMEHPNDVTFSTHLTLLYLLIRPQLLTGISHDRGTRHFVPLSALLLSTSPRSICHCAEVFEARLGGLPMPAQVIVAAARNDAHTTDSVTHALQHLLSNLDQPLSVLVHRGDRVLVKVNMGCLGARKPEDRFTTHPWLSRPSFRRSGVTQER